MPRSASITLWYRDGATLRLIACGYAPWIAILNLAWEALQLPLYTVWQEGTLARIAFAVAHCTAGDVLIGILAMLAALIVTRAGAVSAWNWRALGLVLVVAGVGYTMFSEWANTVLRPAWAYSRWMPTLAVAGITVGLSPLMQWLVVPPLALYLARLGWPRFRSASAASQPPL